MVASVNPEVRPVSTACGSGDQLEVMPQPVGGAITEESCSVWCESTHPFESSQLDKWCCQLSSPDGKPECSWSSSFPRLEAGVGKTEGAKAYGACPPATAPNVYVNLKAKITHTEYDCGSMRKATDVINIDGDGTTTCSQICLPPAFTNIALKHGCSRGRCQDLGFVNYVYSTKNTGIPLNVYAKPGVEVAY